MSLYSPKTDPKYQHSEAPAADDAPPEVVVSVDTQRENRVPNGQYRTRKWPVLHATSVPKVDLATWQLTVDGLVDHPLSFSLDEFQKLPRSKVFADFHCVTAWSRLGNLWEGVSLATLLQQAGIQPAAKFAIAGAYDDDWTTNVPLQALLESDVLLADTHDGMPIDADHGGPIRGMVPKLYAWKSAKWIKGIELSESDKPGYWERGGYHNHGDPWTEERFG